MSQKKPKQKNVELGVQSPWILYDRDKAMQSFESIRINRGTQKSFLRDMIFCDFLMKKSLLICKHYAKILSQKVKKGGLQKS